MDRDDIVEEPFSGDLPSTPTENEVKAGMVTSDIDAANRKLDCRLERALISKRNH